jgi:hypothetical protein
MCIHGNKVNNIRQINRDGQQQKEALTTSCTSAQLIHAEFENLQKGIHDHILEKDVSKTVVPDAQSPGTCEWIFACPEYNTWLAGGCQRLLWLQGKQGQFAALSSNTLV